jgi:hypothetical protein
MRLYDTFTEPQLLSEIAECKSLKAEVDNREEAATAALLRLQKQSGEISIEHDGWVSTMTPQKLSAALIEREWGYPRKELPPEIFTEQISLVVDDDKGRAWLVEKGHDAGITYRLTVRRKKI